MRKSRAVTGAAFGQVVRRRRKRVGITQEELALDCDLHPTFVSLLERGLRQPSLNTVFLLAARLDVRPSHLVAEVEKALK